MFLLYYSSSLIAAFCFLVFPNMLQNVDKSQFRRSVKTSRVSANTTAAFKPCLLLGCLPLFSFLDHFHRWFRCKTSSES